MYPEFSVWLIISLAILCANAPFFTERMFAFVPVCLQGEKKYFPGYQFIRAFLSYALMAGAVYLITEPALPLGMHIAGIVAFVLLLVIPGFMYKDSVKVKNFGIHLVELIVAMIFVVAIGFFTEGYYANRFTQSWQFYAIGVCIFTVLAFPGFVWRHLMRHPHLPKKHLE